MSERRSRLLSWAALGVGIALLAVAIWVTDLDEVGRAARRLGIALPLALALGGLWHLARTVAWAWCFSDPRRVPFGRLARIRLAAEAFSFFTLRGIAGEPLKVLLLRGEVDAREATAAVALERIAYLVVTTVAVGVAAIVAILTLTLSHGWFRVFRAFAIASGVLALLSALVLAGRGAYLDRLAGAVDRMTGWRTRDSRVWRFVAAVERQLLALARGSARRLAVVVIADLACYALMAAEAWIVLRAAGAPITAIGAFAIETFTRVASFASAFIPANLGALEASSVAAVAAVGAGGGGALALARRIRGLFWAAAGLAVYPRTSGSPRSAAEQPPSNPGRNPLLYVALEDDAAPPTTKVAGLPMAERVLRAALAAGHDRVVVWAPGEAASMARLARRAGVDRRRITIVEEARAWRESVGRLDAAAATIVGPGTVVAPALLKASHRVAPREGDAADVAAGSEHPISGVLRAAPRDASDIADVAAWLRERRSAPLPDGVQVSEGRAMLVARVEDVGKSGATTGVARAEAILRRSVFKPTDAKIARFNRRLSLPISIALLPTPVTPNMISIALVGIGLYAAWLFSRGTYWAGVAAAALSLVASILDGCDGEIARLKHQESAFGCWLETIGDYSYYLAIFAGLAVGAARSTRLDVFYRIGGLALGGTLLSFALLIYLRRTITAGRPERLHAVARARFRTGSSLVSRVIWRISFVATRAAMPYGILAFALAGLLPGIVVLAAIGANVYWVSLTLRFGDLLGDELAPNA